jgi:hypothetical protein
MGSQILNGTGIFTQKVLILMEAGEEEETLPEGEADRPEMDGSGPVPSILTVFLPAYKASPIRSALRRSIIDSAIQHMQTSHIELSSWPRRRIVKWFSAHRKLTISDTRYGQWTSAAPCPIWEPALYRDTPMARQYGTYLAPTPTGYPNAQELAQFGAFILNESFRYFIRAGPIAAHPNNESPWELVVDLFATTNLPLSFIKNKNFVRFLHASFPLAKIPNFGELRAAILKRAQTIRLKWVQTVGRGSVISFLTDAGLGAGKNWLGIVACAPVVGFHFWSLEPLPKGDSQTIADILATKINELTVTFSLRVGAVVTDNAANEKAALNPEHVNCVQSRIGRPLVRVACMSHTINLMIKDLAKNRFPGRNLYKDLALIIRTFNDTRAASSAKLTTLAETRWDSMQKVVYEIVNRHNYIQLALSGLEKAQQAFLCYDWFDLHQLLTQVHELVLWSENNETRLCDVWARLDKFWEKLRQLADSSNMDASFLSWVVLKRRHNTCDEGLLLLSHLMTKAGLGWFQRLPDIGDPPGEEVEFRLLWSKQLVRYEIEHHLVFYARFLGADANVLRISLERYLNLDPNAMDRTAGRLKYRPRDEDIFWDQVLAGLLEKGEYQPYVSFFPLANMAKILLAIPVSESDVERVFSHMDVYFGVHAQGMKDELIEARLMCKLDGQRAPEQMVCGLNQFIDFRAMAAETVARLTARTQNAWGPAARFSYPGLQNRGY